MARGSPTTEISDDVSEQRSVARSIFGSRIRKAGKGPSAKPTTSTVNTDFNRSNSVKNIRSQGSVDGSISRWRSKKIASSKKPNNHNQIVADFFDVQSFASAPALGAANRSVNDKRSQEYETQSVVSKKSRGGNFVSFFFRAKNVINDEVDDEVYEEPDEEIDYSNFYSLDDEELTLGSGLHSEFGEYYYEDTEDSTVVVQEKIQSLMKEEMSEKNKKKKGILSRILQRRKDHKARKIAEKEAKTKVSLPGTDDHTLTSRVTKTDSPKSPPESSLSAPDKVEKLAETPQASTPPPPAAVETEPEDSGIHILERSSSNSSSDDDGLDSSGRPSFGKNASCRWSCDSSIESNASAPKPPVRRNDSGSKIEVLEDDNKDTAVSNIESVEVTSQLLSGLECSAPKPPQRRVSRDQFSCSVDITVDPTERSLKSEQEKAWRDNVRREIALRSGKDLQESKENFDDDSDESVLSLLSGLLATWSAEREGSKGIELPQLNTITCGITFCPTKSILKTSDACPDARPRYSVAFDNIIIREYERTVGDNPSCSRGPPISIGWSYVIAHEYPIDDYELLIKAPKRSKKEFHLSADIRTHLLMEEWDCTEEDIRKARREVTYIQYCRAKASFSGVRTANKEAMFLRKGSSSADNSRGKPPNRRQVRPDVPCVHPSSPKHPHPSKDELPSALISPSSTFRQQVLIN